MDGTLKLVSSTLAYADVGLNSNPLKKYVDWGIQRSYSVSNPKSVPYTVDPGASLTIFNDVRTLLTDGTTKFDLEMSTLAVNRYRLSLVAGGTDPRIRTLRTRGGGFSYTVAVNANSTITLTVSNAIFTTVVAGDVVFIPDTTTGDAASPFNPLNTGYWTVVAVVSTTALQLARPTGTGFIAFPETVAVVTDPQLVVYSAAGVQVGDSFNISAGFSSNVWGTYKVVAVTQSWVEFVTSKTLPFSVTAFPGAAGIQFYPTAKRFVRFEADQECVVRLNGDTGNTNQITPWAPADADHTGWYEKVGPCWSAVVVNLSSSPLNLLSITAE